MLSLEVNIYNMKVNDFLENVATGTELSIQNAKSGVRYYDGYVRDYFISDVVKKDLRVHCISVCDDLMIIETIN
ncbi:hypothetical protein [Bacillus safensis]|uniref:hypothetical protein n=1 Tax=Bacillus safensis TaxID=561879 RepID=UPI0020CB831C|nr:hypothetical protein [Bacillus safensis]MCP9283543.1 hypothetical protein [Bacillus safensis]